MPNHCAPPLGRTSIVSIEMAARTLLSNNQWQFAGDSFPFPPEVMQELYRREEVEGERLMNIRRDPHYLALARPNAAIPVQDFLYPDPDWVEERHLQALRGARQVSQEEDTTLLDKFLKFYLENDVPLLPEFDFEAFRWTLGSHTQEEQTESRYGRSDCEDRQEMLSCFEGFKTVNELVL